MKAVKAKCKIKTKTHLLQFKMFIFFKSVNVCVYRMSTIHLGIFLGRALFKRKSVSLEELSADSFPAEI